MNEITFEEWLKGRFDKPEGPEPWYYDSQSDPPEPPHEVSLKYLYKLFSESGELLKNYSDRQVNDGLHYLFSPSNSNEIYALTDKMLPLEERLKAVESIHQLYTDCFFARCSRKLTHLDKKLDRSVNGICYMLWDIAPIPATGGKTENPELDSACLAVMEKALRLDHEACRESALHGLGHAKWYYQAEVERIIDAFLAAAPGISKELRRYACAARTGMIQ
ncbi:MAG: hypothetical protein M0025_10370 [Elusimicrobia bacterium]|nr:hypothetical protein [Elusimicrobiota bacterium]